MPDQMPAFEQSIEADIKRLSMEIARNREHPEFKNTGERALVKESIRSFAPTNNSAAPQTPPSNNPLPDYAADASPETKLEIEYLLDVALKQGITKALSESQKSTYFVQDAFHDALAGKLYPELQKRGIVK